MSPTPFKPAWWLPEGHSQTLWRKFLPEPPAYHSRERVELSDGDFIDLDWCSLTGSKENASAETVVIVHGLCGCSQSTYVLSLQKALAEETISSVAVNLRGCSGEANRLARAYHSGVSDDLDEVFRFLRRRYPDKRLSFVGFSLGANVLLKWLGETDLDASSAHRAVAVSTPFQLEPCSRAMTGGMSRIYGNYFVRRLSETFRAKKALLADNPAELARLEELGELGGFASLWEFDDRVVAPLHGFDGASHYYQSCSSAQFLEGIEVETLLLQSSDDPLIPAEVIPRPDSLPKNVSLHLLNKGGHVGFVAAGSRNWLDEAIVSFLRAN